MTKGKVRYLVCAAMVIISQYFMYMAFIQCEPLSDGYFLFIILGWASLGLAGHVLAVAKASDEMCKGLK